MPNADRTGRGSRCWRQWSIVPLFLIGELHLGKLSKPVVVHGNAPHNRSRLLVSHLIGKPCELPLHESANVQGPRQTFFGWHSQDLSTKSSLSKEASSLRFTFVYRSTPRKKLSSYWIIGTMMEAIIRRWCCHVGRNNFISFW